MTIFLIILGIILYFVVGYVITKVINDRTLIFKKSDEGDLFFVASVMIWPLLWPLRFIILKVIVEFSNFLVELINELLDKTKKK